MNKIIAKFISIILVIIIVIPNYTGVLIPYIGVLNIQKISIIFIFALSIILVNPNNIIILNKDIRNYLILQVVVFSYFFISMLLLSDSSVYGQSIYNILLMFTLNFVLIVVVINVYYRYNNIKDVFIFSFIFIITFAAVELSIDETLVPFFTISHTDFIGQIETSKIRDDSIRLMSIFTNPLLFSQYLLFILPFLIGYIVLSKKRFTKCKVIAIFTLVLTFQFFTYSRSGLILTLITPLLFYVINYFIRFKSTYRNKIIILFSVILMIASLILPFTIGYYSDSISTQPEEIRSTIARFQQGQLSIEVIKDNLFFGVGLGNALFVLKNSLRSIDNFYLVFLMEEGVVGLVLRFLLLICAYNIIFKASVHHRFLAVSSLVSMILVMCSFASQSIDYGMIFITYIIIHNIILIKEDYFSA